MGDTIGIYEGPLTHGKCRGCGCNAHNPCYDPVTGQGCHWVEDDLCSVCARKGSQVMEPFNGWAILELMGHRRLAGLLSEQEIAGAGFLRLDIPADNDQVLATQFYSPSAVYAITPTSEEVARQVARLNRPEPVARWELPTRSGPPDPACRCGHYESDHCGGGCEITDCECETFEPV